MEQAQQPIEQAKQELLREYPHVREQQRHLLSVPGIGEKDVLPILVTLYRWQTLIAAQAHASARVTKGLVALVGLDPQPYESGTSVHRHAGISRMGDTYTRSLLYMGALGGVRGHDPLRVFYPRLVARRKPKKVALVAAARKILVWARAVFRDQADFDVARFGPLPA